MKCRDCKYFSDVLSSISTVKFREGVGECRKNAPRGPFVMAWMEGDDLKAHAIFSAFAPVPHDDWCGEFYDRLSGPAARPATLRSPEPAGGDSRGTGGTKSG